MRRRSMVCGLVPFIAVSLTACPGDSGTPPASNPSSLPPDGTPSAPSGQAPTGGQATGAAPTTPPSGAKPAGEFDVIAKDFEATRAMVVLDGGLYVVCNGLYKVDPATGTYARVGEGAWADTTHMVAMDGALWMIDSDTLYRTTKEGAWTELISNCSGTQALAALDGALYLVNGEGLFRVDARTGENHRLGGGDWSNTRHMVGMDGALWMVDSGTIYRTKTDGTWTELVKDFAATHAMTAMDGALYVVCNGMYRVDPQSAKFERLGSAFWNDTYHMAGLDGLMWLVDGAEIYRVFTR